MNMFPRRSHDLKPNSTGIKARLSLALGLGAVSLLVVACGPGATGQADPRFEGLTGSIEMDGSNTMLPISAAYSELFSDAAPGVNIFTGASGTGAGFQKFCRGEIDFSAASRPITANEIAECEANGIEFIEMPVAFDALSIVVNRNPNNEFIQSITMEQLNAVWQPGSQIRRWNQIDPSWPDREIKLYGTTAAHGMFDYFNEAVNGDSRAVRSDYNQIQEYNALVQGISRDPDAFGYIGFAFYMQNQERIRAIAVDGGNGPVMPSRESVENGTYTPLSRPLLIYVRVDSLDRREVSDFVDFMLTDGLVAIDESGYIRLPAEVYEAVHERVRSRVTGSVFSGLEPGTSLTEVFEIELAN